MENEEQRQEINRDPSYFDSVFEKMTSTGSKGGPASPLPRRKMSFVVSADACNPGIYEDDFELTIQSLSAGQELAASREANNDTNSIAFLLAKSSITAFNGRPLSRGKGELDFLWESLGTHGRGLVVAMFSKLMPSGDAVKKAEATLRFH